MDILTNAATTAITPTSTDDQFTAAYIQYRRMVRRVILNRLYNGDTFLADDLTQDTFLALYRYRARINFGTPRIAGLLKVMARQSIGRHYAVKRNSCEKPADTGDWRYSNRNMSPAASGACEPVRTGRRTVPAGGAR